MDRFQEMTVFVAVVDAGSFVGAANALQLSKAAVSRQVADLEERLGVRLLHRTTRRLSLTEEGGAFCERARELLAALDEAESEITSSASQASGRLRVNAPLTFGVRHLAPLWGEFLARHPEVTLEVTLTDRVVDLLDEGYDIAVRIGSSLVSSTLVGRRIATARTVLCASPGYLARRGIPEHPRELAHHAVIAYTYRPNVDDWQFHGPQGPVSVSVRPRLYTNNGDTSRAAALADQGVILEPSFIVGPDLQSGALVELLPRYRAAELGIHVVYPSRRHVPAKTRRLIEFLAEAFVKPAWPL